MPRAYHQLPCVRLALNGEVIVDFRYPPDETKIWAEVMARRDPDKALFVDDECVFAGAFPTKEDATRKLATERRKVPRPLP